MGRSRSRNVLLPESMPNELRPLEVEEETWKGTDVHITTNK